MSTHYPKEPGNATQNGLIFRKRSPALHARSPRLRPAGSGAASRPALAGDPTAELNGQDAGSWRASSASPDRSEKHTSELQSHSDLVCRLLLEKKKRNKTATLGRQRRPRHRPTTR